MPASPASVLPPDLAILDLYLFGRIKEQLVRRPTLDEQDLKKEIMAILTGLSEDEESSALDHWIE
jgi:hypothetical protein